MPGKESIKKFILLGLSLFLIKSVLIIYAYLLNQNEYNIFNQSYYTASLLILFGAMGFNIAQTRIPLNPFRLIAYVMANIFFAYLILHIISEPFKDIRDIFSVVLYSLVMALSGILNFKLLFRGNYERYFYILLSLTIIHLLVIPLCKFFHIPVFWVLSIFVSLWFLLVFRFFDTEYLPETNVIEYYKIGLSAFIINSAVSIGLAGDKFIANHFFDINVANTYTFAWSITAPVFYIGTLIEKYLFAEKNPDKKKILISGTFLSFLFVTAYFVLINSILRLFPSLLPKSVTEPLFFNLLVFMMAGYSIYVIFHFPLNAYLFKMIETKKQKTISFYFTIIIIIFTVLFYFIVRYNYKIDYSSLLAVVWIYIFMLLITKAIIIFFKKPMNKVEDAITQSQDFQVVP